MPRAPTISIAPMMPPPPGERLPRLHPDQLDDDARRVYDAIAGGPRASGTRAVPLTDAEGALHGPFNAMLFSPAVGDAIQTLGAAIRYSSSLSDRERELAILLCAVAEGSPYEWLTHAPLARRAGWSEADLAALEAGQPAPGATGDEAAAAGFVAALLQGDVDDGTHTAAREILGDRRLVELVALVGYYRLLALSLRVFRVQLPARERTRSYT